jgi:hypothetical protein
MARTTKYHEIDVDSILPNDRTDNFERSFPYIYPGVDALESGDPQADIPPAIHITEIAVLAGRAIKNTLGAVFPMGPFRRTPERLYTFSGKSPEHVGYQGDLLPDFLFRRWDLVHNANQWLDRLGLNYELKVQSVGERAPDVFRIRLIDTARKGDGEVDVGLSDVGFGISQILPFIVQCLAAHHQVISIEQPEVHIHPKLQADLGDLLAESIRDPYENQFLIETHSEHLILRLQKLVRHGKLKPEDLSVIFVSRDENGSVAQRLRVDEDGDFIDDWPDGFFPERLRELE